MRIFITGQRGQLGAALTNSLKKTRHIIQGGARPDWNMENAAQVMESLEDYQPDVVIHVAALTRVDYCAEHPEEAVRVNGVGTYNVALACSRLNALMVAVSTNEVFDGTAAQPYQEYDHRHPINPYGYSKFVAERVVEQIAPRHMIVRTSWLYGSGGTNFVHKILALARDNKPLKVVEDEVGCPTYAPDLAEGLLALIAADRPGVYHLTNAGWCSRYEFAAQILRQAGLNLPIDKIAVADFKRPSTPPRFAPLANVFAAAAGVTLRPWQSALADFVGGEGQS